MSVFLKCEYGIELKSVSADNEAELKEMEKQEIFARNTLHPKGLNAVQGGTIGVQDST